MAGSATASIPRRAHRPRRSRRRARARVARARAAAGAGRRRPRRRARPSRRGCIRRLAARSSRPCSRRWTRAASPPPGPSRSSRPRGAGYAVVNAEVAAAAEASAGRVVAFARSEPGERFLAELESGLDAGARGIKLHTSLPGYDFSHPQLPVAFALAAERRAPDPLPHRAARCRRSRATSRACSSAIPARRSSSRTARSPICTRLRALGY